MFDINAIVNAAINAAVNARLTEVLQQHANTIAPLVEQIHNLDAICQAQAERIAKLENNPAQGVDTSVIAGNYRPMDSEEFKAAVLEWVEPTTGLTRAQVEDLIEAAIDEHCSGYDHDNYAEMASKVDDMPDFDDFVKDGDMGERVREYVEDALNNASVSFSI